MRYSISWAAFLVMQMSLAQPAIAWQRLYGSTGQENGYSADRTLDGGYITLSKTSNSNNGQVTGYHGETDLWVVKLDASGELQWQRCLGGSQDEDVGSIRSCADGGYILTGMTLSQDGDLSTEGYGFSDIWVVKLSGTGEIAWQQRYGGAYGDRGHRIVELPEGGFVLMGMSQSLDGHFQGNHGGMDIWIAWLNETGEIERSRSYGGSRNELIIGDLLLRSDGAIVVLGCTDSNDGDVSGSHDIPPDIPGDAWVFCAAPDGEMLWQRCLGGTSSDSGRTLALSTDGSILVGVRTDSDDGDVNDPPGEGDIWLARLSTTGDLLDARPLGGTGGDSPWDLAIGPDGVIYVLGQTNSSDGDVTEFFGINDTWLCKLSPGLDLLWQKSFGGSNGDFGRALILDGVDSLSFVGSTSSTDNGITGNYGSSDLWVVKLGPEDVGMEETNNTGLQIFPNPASDELHMSWEGSALRSLEVSDAVGRSVPVQLPLHQNRIELAVGTLAPGLYTVRARTEAGTLVGRFLKH